MEAVRVLLLVIVSGACGGALAYPHVFASNVGKRIIRETFCAPEGEQEQHNGVVLTCSSGISYPESSIIFGCRSVTDVTVENSELTEEALTALQWFIKRGVPPGENKEKVIQLMCSCEELKIEISQGSAQEISFSLLKPELLLQYFVGQHCGIEGAGFQYTDFIMHSSHVVEETKRLLDPISFWIGQLLLNKSRANSQSFTLLNDQEQEQLRAARLQAYYKIPNAILKHAPVGQCPVL